MTLINCICNILLNNDNAAFRGHRFNAVYTCQCILWLPYVLLMYDALRLSTALELQERGLGWMTGKQRAGLWESIV